MANTATSEMLIATFNFAVEVDSVTVAFFREASGLSMEVEVIEHQVVNDKGKQVTQKIAGHTATGEVTLKKSMDGSKYLTPISKEFERAADSGLDPGLNLTGSDHESTG